MFGDHGPVQAQINRVKRAGPLQLVQDQPANMLIGVFGHHIGGRSRPPAQRMHLMAKLAGLLDESGDRHIAPCMVVNSSGPLVSGGCRRR